MTVYLSLLDEQQRHLFAGLESLRCGFGVDSKASAAFGMERRRTEGVGKGKPALILDSAVE